MELKNLNYLQELIAGNLLSQRIGDRGFHILDALLDPKNSSVVADQETMDLEIKNVCAKVHVSVADRVDDVCNHLGISKRVFLEAAMIEACNAFDSIWDELDMDGYHQEKIELTAEAMEKHQ